MSSIADDLKNRLVGRQAEIATLGLGYVGLPLSVEFATGGLHVTGFDLSAEKVAAVNRGESYIKDVASARVKALVDRGRLRASRDFDGLARADALIICVPTPLGKTKDPDLSMVVDAARAIAARLRPGQLVVLESTTYPGTTEELILPILSGKGLTVGESFFLAFSPERVDPGNARYNTRNTPKIIGGVTPACTDVARTLYRQAIETVIPVSSTRTAEMVKLLENTFRSVNIGLVNEVALMCDRLGVDVWEVIDAAATKPFGFMPFYPGPGPGRPLHPDRPALPVLEAEDPQLPRALHRAGGRDQLRDAGVRVRGGGGRAQRPREERQGIPPARPRRGLQARRRRRARVAGPGHPAHPGEPGGEDLLQRSPRPRAGVEGHRPPVAT